MSHYKNSQQIRDAILKMYNDGKSVKQMCKALGFSKGKIDYYRKMLGLMPPRPQLEISAETFARITAMVKKGIGHTEIARQNNLSVHTVKRIINNKSTGRSIDDVLKDPVNQFLARRWA